MLYTKCSKCEQTCIRCNTYEVVTFADKNGRYDDKCPSCGEVCTQQLHYMNGDVYHKRGIGILNSSDAIS